jgi:hypothetical protein
MEASKYAGQMMGAGSGPIGPISGGLVGVNPVQPRTFAQRLESAVQTISGQCGRIEDTLARINGAQRTNQVDGMKEAQIRATVPLAQSVEAVEHLAKRICDIASTLEQVG